MVSPCARSELHVTTTTRCNSLQMARGRMDWDNDLTKVFLDLCIAEKEKLNYDDYKKGLTKTGWQNLYRNFREQTGKCYDKKQLQNKFNSLKRLYKVWWKLKTASGGGWDSTTGTITMNNEWWENRIAEDQLAETFRRRPLLHEHELTILFGSMGTEDGVGDRMPSGGSKDNHVPVSDDNVSRSTIGAAPQRAGKEKVINSPPPKRNKSTEYYAERMLERSWNETSAMSREQEEVIQCLRVVKEDGVDQGSELYFIATELFRSAARRAAFQSIGAPENRIAWLRWTWENARKK